MSKRSEKKAVKRSLRLVRNWPRSTWNPRTTAVVIPAQRTPERESIKA